VFACPPFSLGRKWRKSSYRDNIVPFKKVEMREEMEERNFRRPFLYLEEIGFQLLVFLKIAKYSGKR